MGRIRDKLRDIFNPTPKTTAADVAKVQFSPTEVQAAIDRGLVDPNDPRFGGRFSGGGGGSPGVAGDGGAAARARALALEQARQAEAQRQAQLEARQSQLQSQRQRQAQQQQTIVASKVQQTKPRLRERFVQLPVVRKLAEFERRKQERKPLISKEKEKKIEKKLGLEKPTTPLEERAGVFSPLFPSTPSGKKAEKVVRKVTGFDFLEKQVAKQEEKFPEGKAKDILFQRVGFRVTDVAKFGFFSPALATTPQALSSAIRTGGLKPVVETKFRATIKPQGAVQQVRVATTSKSGGLTIRGSSQQIARDLGDDVSQTIGRGIIQTGKKGKFQTFKSIGTGKITGRAGITKDVGGIKVTKDLGQGVQIQSISRPTAAITEKPFVLKGTKLIKEVRLKTSPTFKSRIDFPSGKITTKEILDKQLISGVIKPTQDKTLFRFVGTTTKPTTRITTEGISKGFTPSQANVKGLIKVLQPVSKEPGVRFITAKPITKTPLSKTFQIQQPTTQQLQSVGVQVGGLQSQASKEIIKSAVIPTSKTITKQAVIPLTTTFPQQPQQASVSFERIPSLSDTGKISELGVSKSRLDIGSVISTAQRQPTRQRQRTKQIQQQPQKPTQIIQIKQIQQPKQTQQQKALLRTQLQQQQVTKQRFGFGITIPKTPKIPKTPFGLFKPRTPKLPKATRGKFEVLGRRFGKFGVVGISKTERGAFALGKQFVGKTLGATFKVPKSKISKLPGFRTKITPQGVLFIEPRRRRLKKRGSEVQEIQIFKQAKKRKKKKGGKKK